MSMPQETTNEIRTDENTGGVSTNETVLKVVRYDDVENALTVFASKLGDLENAPLVKVASSVAELRTMVSDIKGQMAKAAVDAFKRPDEKVEITGDAPAIITSKKSDFQPGEWVAEKKAILIGDFDDLPDADGSSLGLRTRWFDTAMDFGLKTFNDMAEAIANDNSNGRGGLRLNPARYQAELFAELKTGEAAGKNVIAPLKVVQAIYKLRNKGEYKRRSKENLPGKLITVASGSDFAHWQWSCSPHRFYPFNVRAVDFTDGLVDWYDRDDGRLSGRACFAELKL